MQEITVFATTKEERETLFIELYLKAFPAVARYVSRRGGSLEEAKDIFQDSLILYYEKAESGIFSPETNEKAYILGIARHLWLKKYRENNSTLQLERSMILREESGEEPKPSQGKLMKLLETAGKKCMELLRAFYYDKQSMNEVADVFQFSNVRSATVQKYKCLEKVRDKVKEKSLTYESFLD